EDIVEDIIRQADLEGNRQAGDGEADGSGDGEAECSGDGESGDEEASPPSYVKPVAGGDLADFLGGMSFGSFTDSDLDSDSESIDSFDFIDRSTSIREVFADRYDGVTDPEEENTMTKYHQVCAIDDSSRQEDETSVAFDDLGNPYIDPADLTRGLGSKYVRPTPREKLHLPQVHLSGAARSWIKKLPEGSIDSWETFEDLFVKNFRSTCKKPASIEVLRACKQKTMPFGLKNAGATYQRMMQKCLATQIGKNVQVYIDNVVITTKQGLCLIDDLRETFDSLDKFLLKLNPTKCSFGVPAGELLGYLVSARGIEANPEKIQAIVTMRKPTKLKEIHQLTGRVAALSRSKRLEGAGVGVILVSPQGDKMKYIQRMTFPNASNNEAEYETLIHRMKMAKACGATRLKIFGDSQLVAQQVMNKCDVVNDSMIAYKEVYNELEKLFDGCEVNHISRLSNDESDVLANIGSQCLPIPPGVFWEEISERSTKAKKAPKQPKKKEKAKEGLGASAAQETNASEDEEEPEEVMMIQVPWMQDSHEKFESPWIGPYIVTEVIPGGAYRLKDKKTGKDEPNPWNVAQLRRFYA
ncbi:hypothetical protein QYE76_048677, partial [Lolium multiflorum]